MEAGYKQAVTARVGIALLQYAAAYAVVERVKHLYTASGTSGEKYTENVLDKEGQIVATKGESASPQYDFYHYDIRNSVTNIVKSEGSTKVVPTQENEYDIFGKTEQSATNSSKNEVKFTGALHEQQNGLYYMNARHYDPSTGRFLQQDVYKGEYGAPWTQNRYTYCGNNPVNMVDPSGHAFLSILVGAVVGGVVSAVTQYVTTGQVNMKKVFVGAVSGAAFGVLGPSALALSSKMYIGAGIGATAGASNEIIDAREERRKVDRVNLLFYSATGAISGAVGAFIGHVTMGTDGIVSNTGSVVSSFNAAAVEAVVDSTVYYARKKYSKPSSKQKATSKYNKPVKKNINLSKKQDTRRPVSSLKAYNSVSAFKIYMPSIRGKSWQ